MVRLKNAPVSIGRMMTVDMEIGAKDGTHSYRVSSDESQIRANPQQVPNVVVHNTVSLLAGATPGCHFPVSTCYIRRVRLPNDSPLIPPLQASGFHIEPCFGSEKTTSVVEFPVKFDEPNLRKASEVSVWEKAEIVKMLQRYWADNQVSVTIDFDRVKEGPQLKYLLASLDCVKSVSLLPRLDSGTTYRQMPYEEISEEVYQEKARNIKPIDWSDVSTTGNIEEETDKFCDGDKCVK